MMLAADAVTPPAGAGRQQYVRYIEIDNILRAQSIIQVDVNIGFLPQQVLAVIAHPRVTGHARQFALARHPAAQRIGSLRQGYRVTAICQLQRTLEAGRAGADDQHRVIADGGIDTLRMPALLPFLALGRVLRTANRRRHVVLCDTDIATDAFANFIDATLIDLARQERVGDRRTRRTDQVEHAAPYLRHHRIGGGKTANPDHRLAGQGFYERGIGLLVSLVGLEARGRGIVTPVAYIDIPKIRDFGQHGDNVATFRLGLYAMRPH